MKKSHAIFFSILFFIFNSSAQITFQKTYSVNSTPSSAYSSQLTSDGGFIITGTCDGNSTLDVFLLRLNAIGDTLWTARFDGLAQDEGLSVVECFDGGFAVCGNSTSFPQNGHTSIFLLKTDSLGNQLWLKKYEAYLEDGVSEKLIQTNDSGFAICGRYNLMSRGILIKTNATGNLTYCKKYGDFNCGLSTLQQTSDNGFIFTGRRPTIDLWILKQNVNGSTWSKSYSVSVNTTVIGFFSDIRQTSDGGYIVGCTFTTYAALQEDDICLIKLDSTGIPTWAYVYQGIDMENNYSVEETSDGGYIASGRTWSNGQFSDLYVLKVNSLGSVIWFKTYGGLQNEYLIPATHQSVDGGYITIASSTSFNGFNYDEVYCIKSDSIGVSNCNETTRSTTANPLAVQYSVTNPYDSVLVLTTTNETFIESRGGTFTNLCFNDGLNLPSQNTYSINLFPNPAITKITVQTEQSAIKSISIFNLLSENVLAVPLQTSNCPLTTVFDVSSLPSGLYFLQATTDEGIMTSKFIKASQ